MKRRTIKTAAAAPAALLLALSLAACGGDNEPEAEGGNGEETEAVSGEVVVDGSSTVEPLTSAAGELYLEEQPEVAVSVAASGTGGGFEKFCAGDTDLSNASREIKTGADDEDGVEGTACETNGVDYTEMQVAVDALTVIVSADNDFITCLTTEELATLWGPDAEGTVTTWDQVNPDFPAEPIDLYGPGTDSGTFDYFTAEITGEEGASRTDYNASEDDNVIVAGVAGSTGALGYLGYTYYEENVDTLKAVEIDSGGGCVAPSVETAQDGTYAPLARPLFVYVSNSAYADKPQVSGFIEFYVENVTEIAEVAQFIPLNEEQLGALETAAGGIAG